MMCSCEIRYQSLLVTTFWTEIRETSTIFNHTHLTLVTLDRLCKPFVELQNTCTFITFTIHEISVSNDTQVACVQQCYEYDFYAQQEP